MLALSDLRVRLAEAHIQARAYTDLLKVERAQAEQRAIEAAGGEKALGANAEARERALTIAIADDPAHRSVLGDLRAAEAACERLQAEIDVALDERRAYEWGVRDRLADALLARGIQTEPGTPDGDVPYAFDDAFDDAAAIDTDDELDGALDAGGGSDEAPIVLPF